ncbi:MAG: cation diffusion facilitator family transporter, partial [Acidobacteriota bacterium]
MHEDHSHGVERISRKLAISTAANVLFIVVELSVGIRANSLALIGDALHNFTDALALLLALAAVRLARRPPTPHRSFGFQRAGILAAFINAGALVVFTLFIFIEAAHRLRQPQQVTTSWVIAVASLGVIINGLVTVWLREESRHDVNVRSAMIHMFGDALASVGVIVAALLIRATGNSLFDPLVSLLIALLILWSSWGILRETVNLLLEGTPRGVDPEDVARALAAESGVFGVHHLHIWALAPSRRALSCHLQLGDVSLSSTGELLRRVNEMLGNR